MDLDNPILGPIPMGPGDQGMGGVKILGGWDDNNINNPYLKYYSGRGMRAQYLLMWISTN